MAISINWSTQVIFVPQSDLTFVSGYTYELDINWFRLQLKNLEDTEEGMSFPDTHRHNTQITLGGVTLARAVEIINGYTITFEELIPLYAVNLVGSNSNIADVTNLNSVQIRSANSAGLVVIDVPAVYSPQQIAAQVWGESTAPYTTPDTFGWLAKAMLTFKQFISLK